MNKYLYCEQFFTLHRPYVSVRFNLQTRVSRIRHPDNIHDQYNILHNIRTAAIPIVWTSKLIAWDNSLKQRGIPFLFPMVE